jgi:hypothetical protein
MSAGPSDYPVILAVEDFVPTLLALGAFWLLGATAPGRTPLGRVATLGRAGAVLIGAGGVAKSLWKLLVAGFGVDLPMLEQSLFPLMSTGALLVIWALHGTLRGRVAPWWPYATVWVAVFAAGIAIGRMQPIFILATAGVTMISVLGAVLAGRGRDYGAIGLYVLGIVLVTSLVPLRGHPRHETLTFQWLEQGINTAAQAITLLAAWLTVRALRSRQQSVAPQQVVGPQRAEQEQEGSAV